MNTYTTEYMISRPDGRPALMGGYVDAESWAEAEFKAATMSPPQKVTGELIEQVDAPEVDGDAIVAERDRMWEED